MGGTRTVQARVPLIGTALAAAAAGAGWAEAAQAGPGRLALPVVIVAAVAVGLHQVQPGAALALAAVADGLRVLGHTGVFVVEGVIIIVIYGAARHGRPLAAAAAFAMSPVLALVGGGSLHTVRALAVMAGMSLPILPGVGRTVTLALAGTLPLLVPWLLGMLLRARAQARASRAAQQAAEQDLLGAQAERERADARRAQAEEVVRLRERQTRLARDVHDVVGHSLAVILAQAEAAKYLSDDPDRLSGALSNIATTARGSLRDVRQVLASTGEDGPVPEAGLDGLIAGVRAAGHDVQDTVTGAPVPLTPEHETVAYRVLQEMLTNALRHGVPGGRLWLERDWLNWPGWLRLQAANDVAGLPPGGPGLASGLGVPGMRRRLELAGGHLETSADTQAGIYRATAWIPVAAAPAPDGGAR